MNLNDNLQTLRKRDNLSQEQLAEKLLVSRQAVSKWESGVSYPEMDKLIAICEIFNCSMDDLVKGTISLNENVNERNEYDSFKNAFSKAIAFGVGFILLGVTIIIALGVYFENTKYENIIAVPLLINVTISTYVFIYYGIKNSVFEKKHSRISNIYTENEVETFNTKFGIAIATGVALILIGVTSVVGLSYINSFWEEMSAAILLALVTIATTIFVYFGLQKQKYEIEEYNREHDPNRTEVEKKSDRICGVIMLVATLIFLAIGFLLNLWHPGWVVFPLGGILCAIVSTAFGDEK